MNKDYFELDIKEDVPYEEGHDVKECENKKCLQYKLRCLELASGMGYEYETCKASYVLEVADQLYKWLLSDSD